MSVKGYVITNAGLVAAVFATSLDAEMKAIAMVMIAVVSLIANILWIYGKFRDAIIKKIMHEVEDEIRRLDYLRHPVPTLPDLKAGEMGKGKK